MSAAVAVGRRVPHQPSFHDLTESLMNTKSKFTLALIAAALAATAVAQQPGATGGAMVASEPGKAAVVRAAELSAQVVAIDKATRTLTLKGPKGDRVDLVAGEDVRNFDQIKLGDFVVARYAQALTLELKKTRVAAGDVVVREEAAKAKPASVRPSPAGARSPPLPTSPRSIRRRARSR